MAKPRKRYYAKGNIRINDVKLEGQEFMLMGECDMSGNIKRPNGKPLLKRQKTHLRLRFADRKWLRENNLLDFLDKSVSKEHLSMFFTEEAPNSAQSEAS